MQNLSNREKIKVYLEMDDTLNIEKKILENIVGYLESEQNDLEMAIKDKIKDIDFLLNVMRTSPDLKSASTQLEERMTELFTLQGQSYALGLLELRISKLFRQNCDYLIDKAKELIENDVVQKEVF